MFDLSSFSASDALACTSALEEAVGGVKTMEASAERLVRFFYEKFVEKTTGQKALVLARLYKSHPYGELDGELKAFADKILGKVPATPQMKCLTLMATAGMKPEWDSRQRSNGHRAIPLSSPAFVEQAPMISQLLKQFGMDIPSVLNPTQELIMDMARQEYNVFHVPSAVGSPYIPAQKEFVVPYGVKSVVGFGGMLLSGDIVAVILFSRVAISKDVAERFKAFGPRLMLIAQPFVQARTVFS